MSSSNSTAIQQPQAASQPQRKTLEETVSENRVKLQTSLSPKTKELIGDKWDSWSEAVRAQFIKRAHDAIIAAVQTTVPKKQWAQWEVTLKFCLDDVFTAARQTPDKKFAAENGLGLLLIKLAEGKQTEEEKKKFDERVNEMLAQMKPGQVPGFDVNDRTHSQTLQHIRGIYSIEWGMYVVAKLTA